MKIAHAIMLLVFLVCAFVQYNDPDPLRWIAVYLAAALLCFLALTGRLHWGIPALCALFTLIWAVRIGSQGIGGAAWADVFSAVPMKNENVERTREALGLLCISGAMFWLACTTYFKMNRLPVQRP